MAPVRRTPRDCRKADVRVCLTARDAVLLRALARFRLARTSDLAVLCFPGVRRDTVAARLRRLFDAGYLDTRVSQRTEENLYVLGPEGRTWLRRAGETPRRAPNGGVDHHLAIVRTWVDIAAAVHRTPGASLNVVRPDWEIHEALGGARLPLLPDALLELGVDAGGQRIDVRVALELDRGTERGTHLPRKLRLYESVRASGTGLLGWQEFGLALVLEGAGKKRRATVEDMLQRTWGGWSVLWSLNDGPEQPLRELLAAVRAPLTESPSREGRRDVLSRDGS